MFKYYYNPIDIITIYYFNNKYKNVKLIYKNYLKEKYYEEINDNRRFSSHKRRT